MLLNGIFNVIFIELDYDDLRITITDHKMIPGFFFLFILSDLLLFWVGFIPELSNRTYAATKPEILTRMDD